jgi:hypothetical protein
MKDGFITAIQKYYDLTSFFFNTTCPAVDYEAAKSTFLRKTQNGYRRLITFVQINYPIIINQINIYT